MTRFERLAYWLSIAGLLAALIALNAQNSKLEAAGTGAAPQTAAAATATGSQP